METVFDSQLKLYLSLQSDLETQESQNLLQLKLFLLKEMNCYIPYSFTMKESSPFSPALAGLLAEIHIPPDKELSGITLDNYTSEAVRCVLQLAKKKPQDMTELKWYKLLSAILYVMKYWNVPNVYDTVATRFQNGVSWRDFNRALRAILTADVPLY